MDGFPQSNILMLKLKLKLCSGQCEIKVCLEEGSYFLEFSPALYQYQHQRPRTTFDGIRAKVSRRKVLTNVGINNRAGQADSAYICVLDRFCQICINSMRFHINIQLRWQNLRRYRQRPKKSELSGWQLSTRKNFPDEVRKSFLRQKKYV